MSNDLKSSSAGIVQFFKSTKGVLVIAATSFVVLVTGLSVAIYFLSVGQKPSHTEVNTPVMAFWEVMKFAFDPEKMHHISRGEAAYFRAEAAVRKHQYQIAHDNFEEANHEMLLGAGDQSVVAATFLESQAVFENDSGKYALAATICRKVLKIMPFCNDRVFLLRVRQQLAKALVYGTAREKEEACQVCQGSLATAQAVDLDNGVAGYDTETSAVYEWLAYCQLEAGHIDPAIETYKKTVALYEKHGPDAKDIKAKKKITDVYLQLAKAELQRKNYCAAIAYYDAGIAKDPQHPRLYNARSGARLKNHDYDGAAADVLQANSIKPDNIATSEKLLEIYQEKGDAKAAVEAIDRVIGKSSDDDPYLYALRGFVFANQKNLDRAIADLDKCIELNPKEQIYRRYRACVYANAGQYKKAEADLTESIAVKSPSLQAHYLRAQALAAQHQYKPAVKDMDFVFATMHHFGFTVEEIKGFAVSYKFVDKPALLRTRAGYYDLDHQPAKALSDRKAADVEANQSEKDDDNSDTDEGED